MARVTGYLGAVIGRPHFTRVTPHFPRFPRPWATLSFRCALEKTFGENSREDPSAAARDARGCARALPKETRPARHERTVRYRAPGRHARDAHRALRRAPA